MAEQKPVEMIHPPRSRAQAVSLDAVWVAVFAAEYLATEERDDGLADPIEDWAAHEAVAAADRAVAALERHRVRERGGA